MSPGSSDPTPVSPTLLASSLPALRHHRSACSPAPSRAPTPASQRITAVCRTLFPVSTDAWASSHHSPPDTGTGQPELRRPTGLDRRAVWALGVLLEPAMRRFPAIVSPGSPLPSSELENKMLACVPEGLKGVKPAPKISSAGTGAGQKSSHHDDSGRRRLLGQTVSHSHQQRRQASRLDGTAQQAVRR
ncbi:hypothetical protein K491DRAFT_715007 [Lophiostoma macrostomum CBS 122681]|uniref:Uncharacterized protein n=1 Tax=Lophiostoma macrostomum CBS 122681 TaxID=1314788 RepID=A0A6A6TCY8_9PLEO|nr:hypothetical protein K491DRAFT_715007 [Lophiostoma macrostomum CBS 122681]